MCRAAIAGDCKSPGLKTYVGSSPTTHTTLFFYLQQGTIQMQFLMEIWENYIVFYFWVGIFVIQSTINKLIK